MLLLDTHVALWVLRDDPRLGPAAREAITSSSAVHVSAATVLELTIKSMLGKVSIPDPLTARITDQGMVIMPVTGQHAERIRDFSELVRHDPFDRLIVAQAAAAGLQLLTADRVLLGLGRDFVVDATI